jgi:GTP-binding protein HflX
MIPYSRARRSAEANPTTKTDRIISLKDEQRPELDLDLPNVDDELSPTQQRNLEELTDVRVINRSALILDIFAQHARTREGQLQVKLAQLEYRFR